MADVTMPRLSDSMEEGTIVRWLSADGDAVRRGDEIVEVETDKATMAYAADDDGVLHIVAAEGDTLPVGAVIALLLAEGETPPPAGTQAATPESPADVTPAPAPAPASAGTAPAAEPLATAPASGGEPATPNGRVKASPLARRMAREASLDLATVAGSGPAGRIVKADITAAIERLGAPAGAAAEPAPTDREDHDRPAESTPAAEGAASRAADTGTAKGDVTVFPLTRAQQVVSRRMAQAKATVPEFTVQVDIDMAEALALRARLKEIAGEGRRAPSINDMVVKASALALRDHPRANAAFVDGEIHEFSRVNVGVAVAAPGVLVVPTVFDADRKSLGEIARDTAALAAKVREGAVTPPELAGGTFTVSNLGMFGTMSFTAVINVPQAAILAVGAVVERPVARDRELVVRPVMSATLTCDHRVLYGADGAAVLGRIRELLENPLSMAI